MKTFNILIVFFLFISPINAQSDNQLFKRIEKNINTGWTFNYFPDETNDKGYESIGYNDSRWPVTGLPHTWVLYEITGSLFPYNCNKSPDPYWWSGLGWYRKHFIIKKEYSGKKFFIRFSGIQDKCKVWINGRFLGEKKNTCNELLFDITENVKPGEDNVVVVAVSNKDALQSTYNSFNSSFLSGISGDVSVIIKNKLFIILPLSGPENMDDSGPEITVMNGIISISALVKNECPENKKITIQTTVSEKTTGKVIQVIKSTASILPGQILKIDLAGKPLKNLQTWSKVNPVSYEVTTDILDGKEISDSWSLKNGLKIGNTGDSGEYEEQRFLTEVSDAFVIKPDKTENEQIKGSNSPSHIMLSGSVNNLTSGEESIVVVNANVFDIENKPVTGLSKTFKWKISGPGTLSGPDFYASNTLDVIDNENIWHGGLPVSNIIRPSGMPGVIRVTLSAPGLTSGIFNISVAELKSDNPVISETIPDETGRNAVADKTIDLSWPEVPEEIVPAVNKFDIKSQDQKGYAKTIAEYIHIKNKSVDTTSVEFKALISILSEQLNNNNGQLTAFDYNFNIENYNNCRLISSNINAIKLPEFFKTGLRAFYANDIIKTGNQKNAVNEMNWLNWIPSGGIVIICKDALPLSVPKGIIVTEKTDLSDLIAAVHPVFSNYSAEAKERALEFISKMNPYVQNFKAEKGKPVLIPLLKFISD